MALGDSVTAGFAMVGVEPLEFRGDVYSTGGNSGAKTVANYLKHYSADLVGDCTGVTIPLTKKGKGLNVAVSEGQVQDLPAQIDVLVNLLHSKDYSHVLDEWKLLNLFIGANNLCVSCHGSTHGQPDFFETNLIAALTKVRQEIPKVFVNMLTIFNISQVWDSAQGNVYCQNIVPLFDECPCLNANATDRLVMDQQAQRFNEITRKVAKQFEGLNDPQFTVVAQPGIENLYFADLPTAEDFLSDVDCFHPSLCADQAISVALWNNMFQPEGQKSTSVDPTNVPHQHCPSDGEYIQ